MPANIRTSSGELTQFLRGLEKEGYEVSQVQSGHFQIRLDGVLMAVTAASPRDPHHAIAHTQRDIRRNLRRKPKQRKPKPEPEPTPEVVIRDYSAERAPRMVELPGLRWDTPRLCLS